MHRRRSSLSQFRNALLCILGTCGIVLIAERSAKGHPDDYRMLLAIVVTSISVPTGIGTAIGIFFGQRAGCATSAAVVIVGSLWLSGARFNVIEVLAVSCAFFSGLYIGVRVCKRSGGPADTQRTDDGG